MNKTKQRKIPLYMATFQDCESGDNPILPRYSWPLNQIEQMWQSYGKVPKFAMYNVTWVGFEPISLAT